MVLPSTGYATAVADAPSSDLGDFSLMVDLSDMPSEWWSAVDTSDGTKGRAAKDSDGTELAVDWIDFDDTAETGWARINWSGTLGSADSAAARTARIYPPVSGNSSYAAGATYGQHNAYDGDWVGYWTLDEDPSSASVLDRTHNNNTLSTDGSLHAATVAGKVGNALDFDGKDPLTGTNLVAQLGMSWAFWVNYDGVAGNGPVMTGRTGVDNDTFHARYWGDGDRRVAFEADIGGSEYNAGFLAPLDLGGSWHHLVGSIDSLGNGQGYLDGLPQTVQDYFSDSWADLQIGGRRDGNALLLDEVHFHHSERSGAWWSQEYDQTNDNAAFWNIGAGTWTWVAGGINPAVVAYYRRMMGVA
jgi:hypothetical protein